MKLETSIEGREGQGYHGLKGRDSAAAAAGLLRLFLHDLPHPLVPETIISPLLSLCKGM